MRRVTTLLVLALAVAAAGCGGSNSASDTSTATVTETTMTETETSEATETSTEETESDTTALGSFASGDCRKLVDSAQELSQALGAAATDTQKLQDTEKAFQAFVDKAPEEIRPDLQVLADVYSKYIDGLADLDLKPGQTPDAQTIQKLQRLLASVDQTKVTAATQHLEAWTKKNCGTSG
jgi:hypothetical protein